MATPSNDMIQTPKGCLRGTVTLRDKGDGVHPGYLPTLGQPFREVLGTKEIGPETRVYFAREDEASDDKCLCCGDLRLGCDICYKGDCVSVDVHHPRPARSEDAVPLKELDVRVAYHWEADGSVFYSEKQRKDLYAINRKCRVRNWYVTRDPSAELLKKVLAYQMPDFRDRYDTHNGCSRSQIGGVVENVEALEGNVRLCIECHAWFAMMEPTLAKELKFIRGREDVYLAWLENHQKWNTIHKVE